MLIHLKQIRLLRLCAFIMLMNLFVHHPVAAEENPKDPTVAESLKKEESDQNGTRTEEKSNVDPTNVNEQDELFQTNEEQSAFVLLLKLAFYTVIVIAMIYALVKFMALRQKKMGQHHLIQTLGGTSLGPNKSLQIVKVGGKLYVLGVADQITLIKEITDPDEENQIEAGLKEHEPVIARSFRDFFSPRKNESDQRSSEESFQQLFSESLHRQKEKRDQQRQEWDVTAENEKEGRFT